jgi:BirA family biotin operon repressor/biotin-[acetyl-CoA-carboxylase] ligase
MLENAWIIEKLDSVDSSQTYARKFHQKGQMVLITKEQTGGYGQANRVWESLSGNLFTTLSFPLEQNNNHEITLVAVIALGRVLEKLQPNLPYQYKWVNDLLLEGKKAAGILCQSEGGRIFLGLGVNLIKSLDPFIHLSQYGLKVSPEEFLSLFLDYFTEEFNSWLLEGFKIIREAWKAKAYGMNQEVVILNDQEKISGKLVDLDKNGLVLLQKGKKLSYFKGCKFLKVY